MTPEPRPNRRSSARTIHRASRTRPGQAVLASDEPLDLPSDALLEPVLLVSLFEAPPESPPELSDEPLEDDVFAAGSALDCAARLSLR